MSRQYGLSAGAVIVEQGKNPVRRAGRRRIGDAPPAPFQLPAGNRIALIYPPDFAAIRRVYLPAQADKLAFRIQIADLHCTVNRKRIRSGCVYDGQSRRAQRIPQRRWQGFAAITGVALQAQEPLDD